MENSYKLTGFQSPCSEYNEEILSLDERYGIGRPQIFIVEASGSSPVLGIHNKDKLVIDRSLKPRLGALVLLVINNEFKFVRYQPELVKNQDPDSGDFIWGTVMVILRELV